MPSKPNTKFEYPKFHALISVKNWKIFSFYLSLSIQRVTDNNILIIYMVFIVPCLFQFAKLDSFEYLPVMIQLSYLQIFFSMCLFLVTLKRSVIVYVTIFTFIINDLSE